MGNTDKQIMYDCMISSWDRACDWTADALDYLIEEEQYEMVFTQLHNVDALGHGNSVFLIIFNTIVNNIFCIYIVVQYNNRFCCFFIFEDCNTIIYGGCTERI
mgnify:CR=1 FL=1